MKILLTIPHFSPEALAILKEQGEVISVSPSREAVLEALPKCSAAVVGLGVFFDREMLERAPGLKVIATATTGLDHIDLLCAKERGVEVLSLRGEENFLDTITSTAELALGLMLSLARRVPHAHRHVVDEGLWRREDFRGVSLFGKTLGIVGMGRLGRTLARAAEGLRMDVVFTDPSVEAGPMPHHKKVSFDDLLSVSDFVSIHVHLNIETEGMFAQEAFRAMKNSAYLINTARGGIVSEDALIEALKAGEIAGYATDVLANEKNFTEETVGGHPLVSLAREHSGVIIVPHIGGMTEDSRLATDIFIARKLTTFLDATSSNQ